MGQFGKRAHVKWLGIMNLSCHRASLGEKPAELAGACTD